MGDDWGESDGRHSAGVFIPVEYIDDELFDQAFGPPSHTSESVSYTSPQLLLGRGNTSFMI